MHLSKFLISSHHIIFFLNKIKCKTPVRIGNIVNSKIKSDSLFSVRMVAVMIMSLCRTFPNCEILLKNSRKFPF